MASLSLPTVAEARDTQSALTEPPTHPGGLLVVGFGDPAAADYVTYASRGGRADVKLAADEAVCCLAGPDVRTFSPGSLTTGQVGPSDKSPAALVIFLHRDMTARDRNALDGIVASAAEVPATFVCVVSTGESHDEGGGGQPAEFIVRRLRNRSRRIVVFRPGHILSPHSRASAWIGLLGACYPLVPRRVRGCCVEGDELFAAIEQERRAALDEMDAGPRASRSRRPRNYALLGPNRPWRDWLAQHRTVGPMPMCVTIACTVLALLGAGQLGAVFFGAIARRRPTLQRWNVNQLRPGSFRDLLALYNKYNYRHVKVVGYNNGVNHFGHRYPGKTIVSTVRLDRVVRAGPDGIRADCGATIRKARDFLTRAGQDLYVIPNYSYVCLGTAFFVPIHGSAAAFSCVADTITKVVLYDPVLDRLISTSRDEPDFRDRAYDLNADVLLLRLKLRVKPMARYYVHKEDVESPDATFLLESLRDQRAANAEVRKSNAAGSTVQVIKFYNEAGDADSPVLELPRDSLGRLWDRLEENPVTSFLMHSLTRHLAFHVELFFTAEEFATFWKDHGSLPLRKIQLRYIKKDGLPRSPFRDQDCVSADTFMFRRHRGTFEAYLKRTFAVVRANPGKHSV